MDTGEKPSWCALVALNNRYSGNAEAMMMGLIGAEVQHGVFAVKTAAAADLDPAVWAAPPFAWRPVPPTMPPSLSTIYVLEDIDTRLYCVPEAVLGPNPHGLRVRGGLVVVPGSAARSASGIGIGIEGNLLGPCLQLGDGTPLARGNCLFAIEPSLRRRGTRIRLCVNISGMYYYTPSCLVVPHSSSCAVKAPSYDQEVANAPCPKRRRRHHHHHKHNLKTQQRDKVVVAINTPPPSTASF